MAIHAGLHQTSRRRRAGKGKWRVLANLEGMRPAPMMCRRTLVFQEQSSDFTCRAKPAFKACADPTRPAWQSRSFRPRRGNAGGPAAPRLPGEALLLYFTPFLKGLDKPQHLCGTCGTPGEVARYFEHFGAASMLRTSSTHRVQSKVHTALKTSPPAAPGLPGEAARYAVRPVTRMLDMASRAVALMTPAYWALPVPCGLCVSEGMCACVMKIAARIWC